MYEKTFQEMVDLCEMLGGIVVSFEGYDDYDEIRVMCIDEGPNPGWRANFVRHCVDGGFVYGGLSNCVFADEVEETFAESLKRAFELDSVEDVYDVTFYVNEMRDLYDPSRAELHYGTEAWNAYEYGSEVR